MKQSKRKSSTNRRTRKTRKQRGGFWPFNSSTNQQPVAEQPQPAKSWFSGWFSSSSEQKPIVPEPVVEQKPPIEGKGGKQKKKLV